MQLYIIAVIACIGCLPVSVVCRLYVSTCTCPYFAHTDKQYIREVCPMSEISPIMSVCKTGVYTGQGPRW